MINDVNHKFSNQQISQSHGIDLLSVDQIPSLSFLPTSGGELYALQLEAFKTY